MTNAELIQKIRNEIERNRQAIRVLNEHTAPKQMSMTCAIFQYSDSILSKLLSFLSTLEESKKCDGCNNVKGCVTCVNGDQWAHYEESENPINQDELEEELDRFIASGKSVTVDDYGTYKVSYHDFKKVARHFAQWGAEHLANSNDEVVINGHSEDERLGIPMCHHPKRFSEDCVDFNMHEEKEIKESEKTIDIDFEQELYNHFGQVKDFTLGMRIGQYFYELGKQSGSSEIPNDLEEAANEYAYRGLPDEMKPYVKPVGDEFIKNFIAGAKWDRQQMLKEAVECELVCIKDRLAAILPMKEFQWTVGDKVRVIVIPNTDEK